MFSKETLKPGLILGAISLVLAILLAGANILTKDVIAQRQQDDTKKSLSAVMTDAEFEIADYSSDDENIEAYTAIKNGEVAGYCIKVAPQGYGGTITMIVGVDTDYCVTGVSIPESGISETPGLGSRVSNKDYLDSEYIGKSGEQKVVKDGGEINAISGATISSRAVARGVSQAIEIAKSIGGAENE